MKRLKAFLGLSPTNLGCNSWLSQVFIFFIQFYKVFLGVKLGGQCKFEPTCSRYAEICFRSWPWWKALQLTITRLLKCHPFRVKTWDPAPRGPSGDFSEHV